MTVLSQTASDLDEWFSDAASGAVQPIDGTLTLRDQQGNTVRTVALHNVSPVRFPPFAIGGFFRTVTLRLGLLTFP